MLSASSRSARLRAEQRSGSVAATSPTAKTSGRTRDLQRRADPNEARVVQQLGRQPVGVGRRPPDRPHDGVRGGGRLASLEGDRLPRDRRRRRSREGRPRGAQDAAPRRAAAAARGPWPHTLRWCCSSACSPGKYRSVRRPGLLSARCAADVDRRGPAADHGDRPRRRRVAWCGLEAGRRRPPTATCGPAPEPVRHPGRDHQHVVRLDGTRRRRPGARGRVAASRSHRRRRAVHDPHVVEPTHALEGEAVVALPLLGPGQPGARAPGR